MFKNLKFLFFFLFFFFPIISSFSFFSFNQSSVLVVPTPIVQNPDDGRISQSRKSTELFHLIAITFFGIKQVKVIEGEKEYTYPVDLLANTITQLMLEQNKTLLNVDWSKMKGPPRKQLLNLLKKDGNLKHFRSLVYSGWSQKELKKFQEFPKIIESYLLKLKALEIFKVVHPSSKLSFKFKTLNEMSDKDISHKTSFVVETFGLEVKTALAFSINQIWNPWFHTLQNAKVFDLTHLIVGEDKVDVSSLVNSKVQEASALSLKQIQILKKLEPLSLSKLKVQVQAWIDTQTTNQITIFQENWDTEKVSTYLLWLPVFDIQEVKSNQNQTLSVVALATAIKDMLTAEKFDFTKLKGKTREQLFHLLNNKGQIKEEKTFQDDVWKQIKNHQKWKTIEEPEGELSLQLIKTLLVKVQNLGIEKVVHPFFPEGYDLSFLKDNSAWKTISFKNLLAGMTVKINGTNVEFYSSLFPNKVVFQVPMKKLDTVFSEITITNVIKVLEKTITDSSKSKKQLETKNQGLIIGLSVGGGILFLSSLGGFLYWFFKIKK